MRFLLAFALCFVSVFASAQVPMVLGGPQGIDVTRILARNWMSIPTYTDTPAAPLTGSGWPARGFIIHVAKANDTAVWQYTGKKWAKIGGVAENNYTFLVSGGQYNKAISSNTIFVKASAYYIKGVYYTINQTIISGFPKAANANGRIDAVVLGSSGASIIQGTESANPASPSIPDNRLKIGFIYYPPFDTLPQVTGNELTSVFRKPGRDSIYFTSGDTTIAVKDSIGLSTGDTSAMLTNYVNTASNGLTKTGKNIRLGGTLNQTTNIALSGNPINVVGSSDSSRFFGNGSFAVGYRASQSPFPEDSTYRFAVNGTSRLNGVVTYKGDLLPQNTPNGYSLGMTQSSSFGALRAYANGGLSPMQQLEFGFLNTSLNTTGNLSNPTHSNYGLRIYGGLSGVDSGGGSYTNFRISPTINYASNFKKAIHMGLSYEPTIQNLNNTTHIAFRNTRGSNLFNVNSGNTLIGYDTTSAAYQVDTTCKLDVNGNMRVGTIFYGANNIDTALVIRKANGTGSTPGIYIGGANSFNVSPLNPTYVYGDMNSITGTSVQNTVIGFQNNIDSSIANIVLGNINNIPNPVSKHILIGDRHTGNSYTNGQNAAILIGNENNTNGYWGSGLIGSSLKYYQDGQLAFGGNSNNVNFATRNVYFGNGVKVENNNIHGNFGNGPDVAINPSWANDADSCLVCTPKVSNANRNGGSLTIAGGRGTGTGTPGTVRFSTWNTTTSGSTLHPTLTERARISPTGNLLVGTTTDNGYKLEVNGTSRVGSIVTSNNISINRAGISGDYSIAIASTGAAGGAIASGETSLAIGEASAATAAGAIAIGVGSASSAPYSTSLGYGAKANNGGLVSIGSITESSGTGIAIGAGSFLSGGPLRANAQELVIGNAVYDSLNATQTPINTVIIGSNRLGNPNFSGNSLSIMPSPSNGANLSAGNITIAGGRATGNATPGAVIFSTSSDTTSGTALQTLKERARINQNGRLLIGTTTDNGFLVNAVGGATSNGVYGRGYLPLKVDYVNNGNTIFAAGATEDTSSVVIKHGNIGEQYRVLKIFGGRQGDQINVNSTSGNNIFQDTTAFFEITSTNAGFLQPRMTNVERDSISSRPATGLQLFSTTDSANYVYRGTGGGWQKIANEISGSATLDFPSTNGNNKSDLTINGVTGVSDGDVVSLGVPNGSVLDHSCYTAWVSATNQVTVRFNNYGTGALDPASGTFKIKVFK